MSKNRPFNDDRRPTAARWQENTTPATGEMNVMGVTVASVVTIAFLSVTVGIVICIVRRRNAANQTGDTDDKIPSDEIPDIDRKREYKIRHDFLRPDSDVSDVVTGDDDDTDSSLSDLDLDISYCDMTPVNRVTVARSNTVAGVTMKTVGQKYGRRNYFGVLSDSDDSWDFNSNSRPPSISKPKPARSVSCSYKSILKNNVNGTCRRNQRKRVSIADTDGEFDRKFYKRGVNRNGDSVSMSQTHNGPDPVIIGQRPLETFNFDAYRNRRYEDNILWKPNEDSKISTLDANNGINDLYTDNRDLYFLDNRKFELSGKSRSRLNGLNLRGLDLHGSNGASNNFDRDLDIQNGYLFLKRGSDENISFGVDADANQVRLVNGGGGRGKSRMGGISNSNSSMSVASETSNDDVRIKQKGENNNLPSKMSDKSRIKTKDGSDDNCEIVNEEGKEINVSSKESNGTGDTLSDELSKIHESKHNIVEKINMEQVNGKIERHTESSKRPNGIQHAPNETQLVKHQNGVEVHKNGETKLMIDYSQGENNLSNLKNGTADKKNNAKNLKNLNGIKDITNETEIIKNNSKTPGEEKFVKNQNGTYNNNPEILHSKHQNGTKPELPKKKPVNNKNPSSKKRSNGTSKSIPKTKSKSIDSLSSSNSTNSDNSEQLESRIQNGVVDIYV